MIAETGTVVKKCLKCGTIRDVLPDVTRCYVCDGRLLPPLESTEEKTGSTSAQEKKSTAQQIGRPVNQIEKFAFEIEEYALGLSKQGNMTD